MANRPFSICSEVLRSSLKAVLELTNTEVRPARMSRPIVRAVISSMSEKPRTRATWERGRDVMASPRGQRTEPRRHPDGAPLGLGAVEILGAGRRRRERFGH